MNEPLDPSLVSVLRSGREHFNALFAAARHRYPDLDGERFGRFVAQSLAPLSAAVAAVDRDRTARVVEAAYEIGLDLVGQRLIGPGARLGFIDSGWQTLLPRAAGLLARHPFELLAATTNALHQLSTTPGARPAEWMAGLTGLVEHVTELEPFLRLGQVLAWRAGMAHYRQGALEALDAVGERLAREALAVPAEAHWTAVRARLASDPWFDPAREAAPEPRWVGGFRGFGGWFSEPPRCARAGQDVLVHAGGAAWLLTADAFGATLHRATPDEARAAGSGGVPAGLALRGERLVWQDQVLPFEARGAPTSALLEGPVAVVTFELSHEFVVFSPKARS
jgi:hypothetical protein